MHAHTHTTFRHRHLNMYTLEAIYKNFNSNAYYGLYPQETEASILLSEYMSQNQNKKDISEVQNNNNNKNNIYYVL